MKRHEAKIEWLKTPMGNFIIKTDWGYISYNPCILPSIFDFFKESAGAKETALYVEGKGYAILDGDFRKEYLQVFPDLEKCKNIFKRNIKHYSTWSSYNFEILANC